MIRWLLIFIFIGGVSLQLSRYAEWQPTVYRYCETIQNTSLIGGGITCGYSSYNVMNNLFASTTISITSSISLGLINVGWITTEALGNQTGFWNTCKPYMVRVFDGLYRNSTAACALVVNPPSGLPNCTDDQNNLVYRSGSGYCMKSQVCGASVEITFLKSADDASLLWAWIPGTINNLIAAGFSKVATCYGYATEPNPLMNSDNLEKHESFY